MGKTIAAVFLCLSAVSVKGFFAWLLLSASFLQLPEPVSDALSGEQCAPYIDRSKMPLTRRAATLCRGCISLSNAESLFPVEKEVLYSDKYISLVSAHKGKNKGKYIRLEDKTGEISWKYRAFKGRLR